MSKVIQNKGGIGVGAPYDLPGYEYDPVTDKFKDLATGNTFDKNGNAKLENSKSVSITSNGEYQINPSATYDAMKKVTLSVEVQGTTDLEDNKAATIDVSAYTDPVEVTPTEGKDGMKKVTVSLSNIPAGANMLYYWNGLNYCSFNKSPATKEEFETSYYIYTDDRGGVYIEMNGEVDSYNRISDTEFEYVPRGSDEPITITRNATKDLEVWNAPPEVETTKQATIDVSTYDPANKPVITPTAGKQSMGSVEVTLDNIPSGSGAAYAWVVNGGGIYLNIDVAPSTADVGDIKFLTGSLDSMNLSVVGLMIFDDTYIRISDTEFTITHNGITDTYTRNSGISDVILWS